jgi:hypothetical protein
VLFGPPQATNGLAWDRTRTCSVRSSLWNSIILIEYIKSTNYPTQRGCFTCKSQAPLKDTYINMKTYKGKYTIAMSTFISIKKIFEKIQSQNMQ